jgi:hypothetical protein
MNKLLVIFMLSFSTLIGLNAQTAPSEVCTSPTSYNYDEEVTWYFNLTGNTSVTAGQDLYFYSWAPTSIPPTLMTYENNMLWSLTFTPTTLYGVTVADIEAAGNGAFWGNIQNGSGTSVTGTIPYSQKEQLRLGSSCSFTICNSTPSLSDNTFLVNFGDEITNPDSNTNSWTNVSVKDISYELKDKAGTNRYTIAASGDFITYTNPSGFSNPDSNLLGEMAIPLATSLICI